jgi:hypothetical protein
MSIKKIEEYSQTLISNYEIGLIDKSTFDSEFNWINTILEIYSKNF